MEPGRTSGVRFPPPLYFLIPLALSVATEFLFPAQRLLPPLVAGVVGGAFLGLGISFAVSAVIAMRQAGTSPIPVEPSTALVTNGPYRFTRNPMYLGMTLAYLGIAIWTQAIWAFVYLPLVLLAVRRSVIDREEMYLEQRFGEPYLRYRAKVRRWL
jgi:protein-S-isoprenylcysteine O-methyltransferase Ste14